MPYPNATPEQIRKFKDEGFLVVERAVSPEDLARLVEVSTEILRRKREIARDWDWKRGEALEQRRFRIVQCSVTAHFAWVKEAAFRLWATRFAGALMEQELVFWYDQFLGKPPGEGAATPWHQDEAYWGRNLENRGITCWMSFHDVDERLGCIHFVRGGHRRGMLEHRNPSDHASDLLVCDVAPDADIVPCLLKAGSVTFHHSKTPHMATANTSDRWRLTLAQHFRSPLAVGEGGHYPWRVHVSQQDTLRKYVVGGVVEKL